MTAYTELADEHLQRILQRYDFIKATYWSVHKDEVAGLKHEIERVNRLLAEAGEPEECESVVTLRRIAECVGAEWKE